MNVLFAGNALTKTGTTLKKIGNAEKDLMQKTTSQFIHPLKAFLDNDMKTVSVSNYCLCRCDLWNPTKASYH